MGCFNVSMFLLNQMARYHLLFLIQFSVPLLSGIKQTGLSIKGCSYDYISEKERERERKEMREREVYTSREAQLSEMDGEEAILSSSTLDAAYTLCAKHNQG